MQQQAREGEPYVAAKATAFSGLSNLLTIAVAARDCMYASTLNAGQPAAEGIVELLSPGL